VCVTESIASADPMCLSTLWIDRKETRREREIRLRTDAKYKEEYWWLLPGIGVALVCCCAAAVIAQPLHFRWHSSSAPFALCSL
jgi:hypothetical protein